MSADNLITASDGVGYDALIFDWDGTLVDSREVCFDGLSRALADVGTRLDPQWYWPREAIASPDMLLLWEQEFGPLPEPIDEIIVRCRTYVMKAAPQLLVVDANVRIARAAQARGQRLAIGSNSSTNTVAAGLAATGLAAFFDTWLPGATFRPVAERPLPTSSCSQPSACRPSRNDAWYTRMPTLVSSPHWQRG